MRSQVPCSDVHIIAGLAKPVAFHLAWATAMQCHLAYKIAIATLRNPCCRFMSHSIQPKTVVMYDLEGKEATVLSSFQGYLTACSAC